MEKRSDRIITEIEQQLKGCREKDLRFFRIDEYIRNIRRLGEFEAACPACRGLLHETEQSLFDLRTAIESPGKKRASLDRLMVKLSGHMSKAHGYFPPYYYRYIHSAIGLAAGTLSGVLMVLAIAGHPWEFVMAGSLVGIIAGQITGGRKDSVIRSEKRLM